MREMFPDSEIVASDVSADKGEWCAKHFGAIKHVAEIDLDHLELPGHYDLIWLGSVVTHLEEEYARRLLKILRDHTTEHGIIMVSSHGRLFISAMAKAINEDATEKIWGFDKGHALNILSGVAHREYGFSPYEAVSSFDESYAHSESSYGTSLAKFEWWSSLADELGDVRMHFFEAAWDQLHDVVVLQRTPTAQGWRRDIL